MVNGDDGIMKMLLQPAYGGDGDSEGTSQAELVADMINLMRLDVARLGDAAGVDIEAAYMTPERAADLLQQLVRGESLALIEVFNDIEEKRELLLQELEDIEAVYEHRRLKDSVTKVATEYDYPEEDDAVEVPDDDPEDVLDEQEVEEVSEADE
jgi:hypothetical protein